MKEKFTPDIDRTLPEYLDNIERGIIYKALKDNDYNISQTAKELGVKRQTLQYKLKKVFYRCKIVCRYCKLFI